MTAVQPGALAPGPDVTNKQICGVRASSVNDVYKNVKPFTRVDVGVFSTIENNTKHV
jgi:hypothetical protein